jgi:hypothetical protein
MRLGGIFALEDGIEVFGDHGDGGLLCGERTSSGE